MAACEAESQKTNKTKLMANRLENAFTLARMGLGMVELCAKNLQIMHNDFTDYARTFCQLCANYAQRF